MSQTKREALVEEQVPPSVANPPAIPPNATVKPGAFFSRIVSTEFVGFLTTAAVAIVMAFASLGLIDKANTEDIAQKISGIIGSVAALATLLAGMWKYNGGRVEIKKEFMRTSVDMVMAERAKPAAVTIEHKTETAK